MNESDMLQAAFKINEQINFLWNFYVVFSGILLGWIFSTSVDWSREKRIILILLFAIFATINNLALFNEYTLLKLLLADMERTITQKTLETFSFLSRFIDSTGTGPTGAFIVHGCADSLIILLIWRSTAKTHR
ncbi:MAG: hypothetical protein KKE17_12455 [Proteobacteria bacterium]|nr:hypothetical protein [Pseudomonadota bacterium]MBU1710810.1 hypothetical protein [Pseudomonadota bacterium]